MATALTTPAQNPRGRTLSSTFPFPFVSVAIVILSGGFQRLYHTLRCRKAARLLLGLVANGRLIEGPDKPSRNTGTSKKGCECRPGSSPSNLHCSGRYSGAGRGQLPPPRKGRR